MIKGSQKEQKKGSKYVGFTVVKLKAINPTRSELNKLLGKEDSPEDKEINYITQDNEGKDRVRLSFWLYDAKLDEYFVHSFNLSNKIRKSKDGVKTQYVNGSCVTAWSDVEENLPDWFTHFMDESKNKTHKKAYRKALLGEEELVTLIRTWLGRMKWNHPESEVMIDVDLLFQQDYSELRSLINSKYDEPFVILTGVRTDENDTEKQYQQVYGKSFLPGGFMSYIEQSKFPTESARRMWNNFDKQVNGQYGFNAYFELSPITEYDSSKDISVATGTKVEITPTNSKF